MSEPKRTASHDAKTSAGLLLCRRRAGSLELLLAHPGGPYYRHKDEGWWTIPKGLAHPGEDLLAAARREFAEETGFVVAADGFIPLGTVTQRGGKIVHAWAFLGDCDPAALQSNTFELEWPPGSGRLAEFPEVDRAGFFAPDAARRRILAAQQPFIERAVAALGGA